MSSSGSPDNVRQTVSVERVAWARLPLAVMIAAVGALALNALLYALETTLGVIDHSVSLPSMSGAGPLIVTTVMAASAVGAILATIAFAVIGATTRRPIRVFRVVSVVGLLLSFATPATVPGPPAAMRLGLALMHVVTWAVSVVTLTSIGRRSE